MVRGTFSELHCGCWVHFAGGGLGTAPTWSAYQDTLPRNRYITTIVRANEGELGAYRPLLEHFHNSSPILQFTASRLASHSWEAKKGHRLTWAMSRLAR